MMDSILWVVLGTTLSLFFMWRAYKLGFRLGYKYGAEVVLEEWKKFNKLEDGEQ